MAFGRSTRILIVEDDHDSTEALLGLLMLWRFRPRTCRNGRAAMVAVETHPIDVILLDLGLPIMNGWKFAKQLAAAATPKRAFVVAISGYAAGSIDGIERLPALRDWFTRTWTIDLFEEPPQREVIRPAVVALKVQDSSLSYEQIAQMLPQKPTATAVGNAVNLHRKMMELGLDQPYVLLREPPADYTKHRRHLSEKYRFEPLPGYLPPEL
jgi:CheY-like chemotaxis protein